MFFGVYDASEGARIRKKILGDIYCKKNSVYLYVMNRVYGNAILTLLSGMIFAGGGCSFRQ